MEAGQVRPESTEVGWRVDIHAICDPSKKEEKWKRVEDHVEPSLCANDKRTPPKPSSVVLLEPKIIPHIGIL
jgi:hypothetical protein